MARIRMKEQADELFGAPTTTATKPKAKPEVLPPATKKNQVAVHQPAPPAPAEPRNMLAVIANAASNPLVDVAKMKELLAMQREIEHAEQEREFNIALLAAQEKMPRIKKDRENTHTRSRYATLEKVSKEIDHIAHKHGFTMSFGTDESQLKDHYRIVCDLSHRGGHTRRYKIDLQGDSAGAQGKSNKTPIQGVGSTMSYGRRYLKVMMFDLTIVGEDSDGNKGAPDVETITAEQAEQLIDLAGAVECPRPRFLSHLGVAKIEDLPKARFDDAVNALRSFEANKKARAKDETTQKVADR